MNQPTREEWEAWRVICHKLAIAGAITQADLGSLIGNNDTAGEQLLNAIRKWGESKVRLEQPCSCRLCADHRFILTNEPRREDMFTAEEIAKEPHLKFRHINAANLEKCR